MSEQMETPSRRTILVNEYAVSWLRLKEESARLIHYLNCRGAHHGSMRLRQAAFIGNIKILLFHGMLRVRP